MAKEDLNSAVNHIRSHYSYFIADPFNTNKKAGAMNKLNEHNYNITIDQDTTSYNYAQFPVVENQLTNNSCGLNIPILFKKL
jgi:hypothetical protein